MHLISTRPYIDCRGNNYVKNVIRAANFTGSWLHPLKVNPPNTNIIDLESENSSEF